MLGLGILMGGNATVKLKLKLRAYVHLFIFFIFNPGKKTNMPRSFLYQCKWFLFSQSIITNLFIPLFVVCNLFNLSGFVVFRLSQVSVIIITTACWDHAGGHLTLANSVAGALTCHTVGQYGKILYCNYFDRYCKCNMINYFWGGSGIFYQTNVNLHLEKTNVCPWVWSALQYLSYNRDTHTFYPYQKIAATANC